VVLKASLTRSLAGAAVLVAMVREQFRNGGAISDTICTSHLQTLRMAQNQR
jgi:hypothetical protein